MSGMAGNVTAFNTVSTWDIYQTHLARNSPAWIARARSRESHRRTDYKEGFVLPMAIEREALIAAAPNDGARIRPDARSLPVTRF